MPCIFISVAMTEGLLTWGYEWIICKTAKSAPVCPQQCLLCILYLHLMITLKSQFIYLFSSLFSSQFPVLRQGGCGIRSDRVLGKYMCRYKRAKAHENGIRCYLTGREDELVTGQIRLVTEDLGLLHIQILCDLQKPKEMIVYSHSCNSLKDDNLFLTTILTQKPLLGWSWTGQYLL